MSNLLRYRSTHSSKLTRFMGTEKVESFAQQMKGWYGRPIHLLDVPGRIRVGPDGDFVGPITQGEYSSVLDVFENMLRCAAKAPRATLHAGFASISEALARASQGFSQRRSFRKDGPTGANNTTSSLWRVGAHPAAGAAPANAPGGTAQTSATVGALAFANPAAGTNRLVGANVGASIVGNSLLAYDLIFGVNKTMNSTATEAVTGVPTRYQSATATAEDYAGDNFLFVQVGGTQLAATAHNWTVCTYTDEAGNAGATLPLITGNSAGIVDRLDHPSGQWFAALASGDTGIKALTQMQCSAAVATGVIWFMIGHPLGFMSFPIINLMMPFNWLTSPDQAPRIFDNACIAFLETEKPGTTATTYTGRLITTSTSA
jgi:hypothetical protein